MHPRSQSRLAVFAIVGFTALTLGSVVLYPYLNADSIKKERQRIATLPPRRRQSDA
jgi:hypothetical protein